MFSTARFGRAGDGKIHTKSDTENLETVEQSIFQEDGKPVGRLLLKVGAKTRHLRLDENVGGLVVSSNTDLFGDENVVPINQAFYSEKKTIIAAELERSIQTVFEDAAYGVTKQREFVTALTESLTSALGLSAVEPGGWSNYVAQRREAQPHLRQQIALPDCAPAIWKDDKLPGDNPASFITRHYGVYLRQDGWGLIRPDIQRLDSTLYMALSNWLRHHTLPDDCPLPTKGEALDLRAASERDDQTAQEYFRQYNRKRRASTDKQI